MPFGLRLSDMSLPGAARYSGLLRRSAVILSPFAAQRYSAIRNHGLQLAPEGIAPNELLVIRYLRLPRR